MTDDLEAVMQTMTDGEAPTNPEPVEQAPNVEGESSESAERERNADGTFASESASSDESDDTAKEADATDDGESENTSDEADAPEQTERKRTARHRIGELTAQRNEARTRAESAERRLMEFQQNPVEIDPDLEYENPAQFTQLAVRQALAEENAKQTFEQRNDARAVELDTAKQMFLERVETMRDELPDFDQVFTTQTPISETAVEFLAESENGPRIAHHLGKNPNVAHRIASMFPVQQAIALTRLESTLAPPAKRQTKAPKPPGRISGAGSSGTFDPQTASVDDIAKQLGYGKA